mgnify:FL=1
MQHAIADYLSRLDSGEPTETPCDDLQDAILFGLTTTTQQADTEDEWISDMTYFLSTALRPDHLPLDARKRFVVEAGNFVYLHTHSTQLGLHLALGSSAI